MADVIGADNARQFPRCLKHKAVVEHLYLYLGALDAVVAVANRIYSHLPTHFLFRTVILDEAHSGTGKEVLRTLAEKQNAGSADFKSLVMPEKALTSPPK